MKKLVAAILLTSVAPLSFAQTCPTTVSALTGSGNTCTGGANAYSTICGGLTTLGDTDVYLLPTVGASANFSVSVTPTTSTYNTAIFLVGPDACSQSTGCGTGANPLSADDHGSPTSGATETPPSNGTETIAATTANGAAAGKYYLVIGSTAGASQAAGGCGAYTFAVTGSLPVQLKNFAID